MSKAGGRKLNSIYSFLQSIKKDAIENSCSVAETGWNKDEG